MKKIVAWLRNNSTPYSGFIQSAAMSSVGIAFVIESTAMVATNFLSGVISLVLGAVFLPFVESMRFLRRSTLATVMSRIWRNFLIRSKSGIPA
ncbi:hypothetical protein [Celeribacter halophilus]|uniref:hypothetical protein n=1 Tax=Celeribacter halophilus TaxID=576117 RepID=UPI003A91D52B